MKRYRMNRGKSRKTFKKGTGKNSRNFARPRRGGYRL